jgi:hypothetical protein
MVRAAEQGMREASTALEPRVLAAGQATADMVLQAEGYVFATPENLAAMSGELDRIFSRPYGMLICAGSDGSNAARQIERIATGWRLKLVAPPLIVCTQAQSPEAIARQKQICASDLERCRELGATLAGGLELGIF